MSVESSQIGDNTQQETPLVVGLTGPFGSGCSTIAHEILEAGGFHYISLSEILKKQFSEDTTVRRSDLQNKGDELRMKNGPGILASKAIDHIQESGVNKVVIDSIRNTHEIEQLRLAFPRFYLIAIQASRDVRWERVQDKYNGHQNEFRDDDTRDSNGGVEHGQQISLCYRMSDAVIRNEDSYPTTSSETFRALQGTVHKYISLFEGREQFRPTEMETLMTEAYANSLRSSCLQRKVGALIVDGAGNICSSGYNEVPAMERPCEADYGKCYRKVFRERLNDNLATELDDRAIADKAMNVVRNQLKMLDYCRALHAEEMAIVNLARTGPSINPSSATIYSTTYPCNLCANKIVQVGIGRLVYFEPYPQEEAKKTFDEHGVRQEAFEGITFNGYFRLMEVVR